MLGKPCPPRPDLDQLVKRSIERFNAMTPEQQRELRRAQRKSWVVGEMLLEHPDMPRERAESLYDSLGF